MYTVTKIDDGYEIVREEDGVVVARQRLKKDAEHQAKALKERGGR